MAFNSETAKKAGKKSSRAGKPNTTTAEIRERFQMLISDNLETLQDDLASLEPDKRIKYIIELSKFVLPTLKATDLQSNGRDFKPIVIDFVEPMQQITGMTIKE